MDTYEKKYKEALEKARQLCAYPTTKPFISDLQDLFPELKKSEGDSIRKELIGFLRNNPNGNYTCEEMAAWLEKQEEPELSEDLGEYVAELSKQFPEVSFAKLSRIAVRVKNWIEKQGEERTINYPIEGMYPYTEPADTLDGEIENIWNKLRNCDNTFTAAKSGFYEVIHHFANWLEKQVKQKSTDKPKFEIGDEIKTDNEDPLTITKIDEQGYWSGDLFICSFEDSAKWELVGKIIKPKFEVGDWIIHQGTENIYQVVSRIDNQYQLKYGDNYTVQKCADVDRCSRLWDISDAKDGDVLANDTIVLIVDHLGTFENRPIIYSWYFADSNKFYGMGPSEPDRWEVRGFHPATKEQRDQLEKAMANAGYTFNFEKKELKKIKQKPQRMVSAEAKEALYDKPTDEEMKELLRTEYEKGRADTIAEMYVPTQISPEESLGVSSEKYMDIVDTLTQGGQKPAKWSLEDERVIAIINNALTESNTPPDDYDKVYDWLESLKRRIGG